MPLDDNSKASRCTLCGRRWTDPDCPHGVEGLERVGGVGWVPAEVGTPFDCSRGSGVGFPDAPFDIDPRWQP